MGDSRSDDFFYRLASAGQVPYEWPAPNGYPDTALAWSGSSSYVMTWKLLDWLTEANDGAATPAPKPHDPQARPLRAEHE